MDGTTIVSALVESGISHVIWIPDSHSGAWDSELNSKFSYHTHPRLP